MLDITSVRFPVRALTAAAALVLAALIAAWLDL